MIRRTNARSVSLTVVCSALAAATAACGASGGATRMARDQKQVVPLPIATLNTPHIRIHGMHASGRYIQVPRPGRPFTIMNAALRAAVLDDERRFVASDPLSAKDLADRLPRPSGWGFTYRLVPNPRLISASTEVVSALIPALTLFPGGNDGETWFSVNLRVRTATPIRITDLFADPSRGLKALAAAVRKRLVATDPAVRNALSDPELGASFAHGLLPRRENYQHFALTDHGLTIGFDNSRITWPAAGRRETTVPYSAIRPYLSRLGQELIQGVRRPLSYRG